MSEYLDFVINEIERKNPLSAKGLKKNIKSGDANFHLQANSFLDKYNTYLKSIGKDLNYSIDCYLKLIADMFEERIKFLETGTYSNTSFEDVNKRIYANPEIMDYHMHGLVLGQFLWIEQYKRFEFFVNHLPEYKGKVHNYLEIGGGHGLYIDWAVKVLGEKTKYDLVDISLSSLNIAKGILNNPAINYIHKNIFDFSENKKYDFITMGEVLEHLEEPVKMLKKIYNLLDDDGTFFITTPANAPMIDHIYLFNDEDEIRKMIGDCGLIIKNDLAVFSKTIPVELAREIKAPLMYAAFVKKKS